MPMRNATLKVLIYSFSRRRVFPCPAKIHSLVYGIGTSKTCGGQQNLFSKNFYFDFELNPSKGHDRECRKLKNVLLLYGKTKSFYLLKGFKKRIKFWKGHILHVLVMGQIMFHACSCKAKNRVFEFDYQKMNTLSLFDV